MKLKNKFKIGIYPINENSWLMWDNGADIQNFYINLNLSICIR